MTYLNLVQETTENLRKIIEEVVQEQLQKFASNFQPNETDELLTRKETARFFKINISTLSKWVKKGTLKQYGVEGRVYFKRSEIEQALVELN